MKLHELDAIIKEEAEAEESYEDEIEADLNEALEILQTVEDLITKMLRKRNRKLPPGEEKELKELGIEISAFLSQWEGLCSEQKEKS